MPSEKQPFYHPVPPSYDEALARHGIGRAPPRDSFDERTASRTESRSLLNPGDSAPGSSRRPVGYHPPTVETDDEDSIFDSDSDADETNQVRREMEELEIDDPERARGSGTLFGKRINFNITLPRWKWSWRPRLPRWRIQLPSRAAGDEGAADHEQATATATTTTTSNDDDGNATTQRRRWAWPGFNSVIFIIFFARVLAFLIIIGFIYFLFASGFLTGLNSPVSKGGLRFDPEDLRIHLQKSVDPRRMRASVKIYSSYAHLAGTEGDYATAMDVQSMFSKAGLDEVQIDQYYVYLNYPRKDGRTVQLMDSTGTRPDWTAALEEEERGEETSGRQTYAFHGHSKSGDVRGPLIYANYGSREDYQKLKDMGIDTKGAIALVRYYGTQTDRALKVKGAELAGFAGCLIYSDPNDDGFRKGEVAPGGRYMPPDGVQRGSVSLMSWVVGDVLTPGWESTKDMPRLKPDESPGLVQIPSLPLAWRDALTLLESLKGHGQPVPDDWKGGVPRVEWWTGNSSSRIVRLQNEQDEVEKQPIWNVYGKIMGMEQTAKSIILGNHRDAWGFGATDPHTGTAIMIELARIFGDLVERGWRPLRTIEFMSWDAEEYNLIGSTEFVEKNLNSLRDNGYAYINLDTAIFGNKFSASGSPVLQKSLLHAIDRVVHPHENLTLRELWDRDGGQLGGLGAGSDYVAFQDIAGTSSIDLEFAEGTFPYHSSYDNFNLVDTVIDPGFVLHAAMAQVVGLMLLDLADRPILPFDMLNYGRHLEKWTDELEQWTKEKAAAAAAAAEGAATSKGESADLTAQFSELKDAARTVTTKAADFQKWELDWNRVILMNGGWEPTDLEKSRMDYNNKMALFETQLLDLELGGGIPNRTQFKHVVFGPQLWSGYDEAFFPAIRDLVDAQHWSEAGRFVSKTAALIKQAASMLQM